VIETGPLFGGGGAFLQVLAEHRMRLIMIVFSSSRRMLV